MKEWLMQAKEQLINWLLEKDRPTGLTKEEAEELRKECEALNFGIEDMEKPEEDMTEEERVQLQERKERYWRWRELCRIEEKRMKKRENSPWEKFFAFVDNLTALLFYICAWFMLAMFVFGSVMSVINYFEGLNPIP